MKRIVPKGRDLGQPRPGSLSQGQVEAALPRRTSFNPDAELLSFCAGAPQAGPDPTVGGGSEGWGLEPLLCACA